MTIIGITGLIGAGKSTVTNKLVALLNAKRIDADILAKEIIKTYGIDTAGVIGNALKLKKVERQIKPYFKKLLEQTIKTCKKTDFVVFDAPLLYEYGLEGYCDYVINVELNERERTRRVRARGHPKLETFLFLNGLQKKTDIRKQHADITIKTNAPIPETEKKIALLVKKLQKLFGTSPSRSKTNAREK